MFGREKESPEKERSVNPLDPLFTKPETSARSPVSPQDLGEVHTMPEKFLRPAAPEKQPMSRKKVIVIVVAVAVLLGIVGASALVFQQIFSSRQSGGGSSNAANGNAPLKNSNVNAGNTNKSNANAAGGGNANSNANRSNTNVRNINESGGNANSTANSNTNASNANTNTNAKNTNSVSLPPSSEDTDSDTLTDLEEELYGTRLNRPDSDADGYTDGEEVTNGYDPLGNGKLEFSPQISAYSHASLDYVILHPSAWDADVLSKSSEDSVLFTAETGEFMEVIVSENTSGGTAKQWYLQQFPDESPNNVKTIKSRDGSEGVLSVDGLTAYYADSKHVYGITYHIGAKDEKSFAATFLMMYTSFSLDADFYAAAVTGSTNGNTNSSVNTNTSNTNSGGGGNKNASSSNTNGGSNTNSGSNSNKNSNTNSGNVNSTNR